VFDSRDSRDADRSNGGLALRVTNLAYIPSKKRFQISKEWFVHGCRTRSPHGFAVPSTVRRIQQVGQNMDKDAKQEPALGTVGDSGPSKCGGILRSLFSRVQEREDGQANLRISSNIKQILVHSGHNLNLEAPDDVAAVIREVVESVRQRSKF
jgi:hypothetical protein